MSFQEKNPEHTYGKVQPEPRFIRWLRKVTIPIRLGYEPDRSAEIRENEAMHEQTPAEELRQLEREEGLPHIPDGEIGNSMQRWISSAVRNDTQPEPPSRS